MNKTAGIVALFAFCAIAFFGCAEKKADASQESGQLQAAEDVQQVAEEIQYEKVNGVMIYSAWTLYLEDDQGRMIASAETRAGDFVEVYCKDKDGAEPVEKEAIRRLQNGKEEPLMFVRVSFDEKDYWTRPIFVTKQCEPCVAMKDGRLFSSPDIATMTKTVVQEGSVLAQAPADSENDFACVFVYNGTTPYGKKMYVLESLVSSNSETIEKYVIQARIEEFGDKIKPEVQGELDVIEAHRSEAFHYVKQVAFNDLLENRGTMLRIGSSLKKQTDLGMEWAAEIPVGAEFEILSTEPVKADWVWKGGSSKDRTFYKVRYQGKDYFVLTNECALGGQGAVILYDAVLYDKGRVSTFRNEVLGQGTLVVCTGRKSNFSGTALCEAMFYDSNASVVRTRWIWEHEIGTEKDDLKAAQLVKLAQTVKDDGMKREYLSLVSGLSVSPPIREYISDAEALLFPPPMTIATLAESKFASVFCEDGDKVNVRNAPKTGEVVGQLSEGDSVLVDMTTKELDTIDDITSRWYHLNSEDKSKSGWVFGGFLEFDEES